MISGLGERRSCARPEQLGSSSHGLQARMEAGAHLRLHKTAGKSVGWSNIGAFLHVVRCVPCLFSLFSIDFLWSCPVFMDFLPCPKAQKKLAFKAKRQGVGHVLGREFSATAHKCLFELLVPHNATGPQDVGHLLAIELL